MVVRSYVPVFLTIKARQIEDWAASNLDARQHPPVFLRKLVQSTGRELRQVDFLGYDNAQRKGWDGWIESDEATPWIPEGPSGTEPASPQQNGRHERMHRTLKAECTRPPRHSRRAQQRRFDQWRAEYNTLRPHEALADATPASRYIPSPRPYPHRLSPLEYPAHYEIRRVSRNGGIRWHTRWVNVSQTLGGELIGLVEIDDGEWDVYFGPLRLGRFHERTYLIEDALGRQQRKRPHR